VLQNETYDRPWIPSIDRNELDIGAMDFGEKTGGKRVYPAIIGCVTYELLHDRSIRQTAFVYTLYIPGQGMDHPLPIDHGNVPKHLISARAGANSFVT
jgi:hypothetical protein